MTSNSIFPSRLTQVDDLTLGHHHYLTASDACVFLGEYTARKGYAFSITNQLILNFKKSVQTRGTEQWKYKGRAIQQAAAAFAAALPADWLNQTTLIPIPPSKAKNDPLYDDRMVRMLNLIRPQPPLDVRELLIQVQSTEAAHGLNARPRPEDIERLYVLDEALCQQPISAIGIFDDVLTTGAHFRAAQTKLQHRFPGIPIVGLFIARRVPEAIDFDAIEF